MLERVAVTLGLVALGAHAPAARCEVIYNSATESISSVVGVGAVEGAVPGQEIKQQSTLHFSDSAFASASGTFYGGSGYADARTSLMLDVSTQLNTVSVLGTNSGNAQIGSPLLTAGTRSSTLFRVSFTLDQPYAYDISAQLARGTSEDLINTLELGGGSGALFRASGGTEGGTFQQSGVLGPGSYYFLGRSLLGGDAYLNTLDFHFDESWNANLHLTAVPLPAGFGLLASALSLLGLGKSWIRVRA